MRWERIRSVMGPELVAHLAAWREAHGSTDGAAPGGADAFLNWLLEAGRISPSEWHRLQSEAPTERGSAAETLADLTWVADAVQDGTPDAVDLEAMTSPAGGGPPFTALGRLAAGAMGEVWIVRERDLNRKVALKRMHPQLTNTPRLARRFLHEAQITAQLDHPNIVPVYRLVTDGVGPPAYTMKLVRGRTFAQLVREARERWDAGLEPEDELATPALLENFVRACDALAYAHSRGVVHRDLKPENIMVGAYGEVYVMDWGIARVMGAREASDEEIELHVAGRHRTRHGAVLGTPAYMSPEQALGQNEALDGRSDVYALGLILGELVTLRARARDARTLQLVERRQLGRLEALRHHRAGIAIAPQLRAIVERATRLDPRERYPSATALAEEVRRYLRGAPVEACPETLAQRGVRWLATHRVAALALLVATLSVLGGTTILSLGSTLYTVSAASHREARLSTLQSEVAFRARQLDARFQALPAYLDALSAATLHALAMEDPPDGPTSRYYLDIGAAPDLAPSAAYGRPISLDHPHVDLPLRTSLDEVRPALRRLATLAPIFRRVLVDAHGPEWSAASRSRRDGLLREEQSPVRWIYLALESGLGLSYPGHEGMPPGVDLRREPWYRSARGGEVVWGRTRREGDTGRTLLSVSRAIFDDDGWRLGAVALEVGLEAMTEGTLALRDGTETEVAVLDADGGVLLARVDGADEPRWEPQRRGLRRPRYRDPRVLAAIAARRDGYVELVGEGGGVDLVLFGRMDALGWTYVVRGPRDGLMR